MRCIKKILTCLLFTVLMTIQVWAASSFVVRAIRFRGLNRLSKGTVLNYLPVHVGETIDDAKTAEILRALYNTGFFQDVSIGRSGNTLVVNVVERPSIASVNISGNSLITKKQINTLLKQSGIVVGEMFDHAAISSVQQALRVEYYNLGHYNARVSVTAVPEQRNRVAVKVVISEGAVAKIRNIKIIGNHVFTEHELKKQFILTTPNILSVFTKDDQYSKEKLDASLEALRSYYLNNGYIHFKIESYQVALTPDRSGVYIIVKIYEGPQYHFNGFKIKGRLVVPRAKLRTLVNIQKGDVFSRMKITEAEKAIGLAMGNKGYGFAKIEPVPTIDEKHRQVFITFYVAPGKQVYVRRINFSGNSVTAGYVLRNAVQQMEGGLLNVSKVRQSIRQLNLLGFFKDVNVKTVPVPGTNNQVDLDYSVKEKPSGQASVNVGYNTATKFEVGAGINQPNFMGTGRTVGLNYSRSSYSTSYSFNYYNPYATPNGVGRGFNVYYTHTSPKSLQLANYTFDTYGGQFYYNIPLSLNDSLNVGLGFDHIKLNAGGAASTEIMSFIRKNGSNFNQATLSAGISHVGQNRAIFPTKGFNQSLSGSISVPVAGQPLKYYKAGYYFDWLRPFNRAQTYILELNGGLGYGNGYGGQVGLPFFVNYYAGGLSQGLVRGYDTNGLGPRDSNGDPIGGNTLVYGSAAIIFPNPISTSVRTSIFVDAGNVYQTNSTLRAFDSRGSGPMRYSAGLAVIWRSPIGPLSFSLGYPLNKQKGDQTQVPQFTMGTSF